MTRDDLLAHMLRLGACSEPSAWVESQDGSAYDLWRRCDRGDWLLWLAVCAGVDRRLVVLAACDCAETALVHVPADEERPRAAIETAQRWARGEATLDEVRVAASAAAYAADSRARSLAESAQLVRRRIQWSAVRDALSGG